MTDSHDTPAETGEIRGLGQAVRLVSDWLTGRLQGARAPSCGQEPVHDWPDARDPFASPLEEFH